VTIEQAARLEAARGNAERLVHAARDGDPLARALAVYALNVAERLEQPETIEQGRMV
jgi:hypothetical protein